MSVRMRDRVSRIKTYTGKVVDLERPTVDQVDIRDIAHALSQINRFTGHTVRPYSVAEHCVIGSRLVSAEFGLEFLLHDATEAYLGDVSSPLKALLGKPYTDLEAAWSAVIARKFRLRWDRAGAIVKDVDEMMLRVELRTLVGPVQPGGAGADHAPARELSAMAWLQERRFMSKAAFLGAFAQLSEARFADLIGVGAE